MNATTCEVCAILPKNNPVFETASWMVTLSPDQGYLARCYVTLKEHKADMADLTQKEWLEFADCVKKLEGTVRASFGATLFNWGCLMNNAFQVEPALPHVHWHVRPRYESPVIFENEEFSDPLFGRHYDRSQVNKVSKATLNSIRSTLQANLKV